MKPLDRLIVKARRLAGAFPHIAFIEQDNDSGQYVATICLAGNGPNRITTRHDTPEEAETAVNALFEQHPSGCEPLVITYDYGMEGGDINGETP